METNTENVNSQMDELENTDSSTGEQEQETEEAVEEETATEEQEEKPEYTDLERQQHAQIKKLKEKLREKEEKPVPVTGDLSAKDLLALNQNGITSDDLDEVMDFARYKKIPIAEALKSQTLKTILNDKREERRTAEATATKSPRGITKSTGDDLLQKAEKTGEIPTTQSGLDELVKARLERKMNRKK